MFSVPVVLWCHSETVGVVCWLCLHGRPIICQSNECL